MHPTKSRKVWLLTAVAVPVLLVVLNVAYGQRPGGKPNPGVPGNPGPPNPGVPEPPGQPHQPGPPQRGNVMVWSCSRCNRELGTGAKPNLEKCPHCGAHFRDFSPSSAERSSKTEGRAANVMIAVMVIAVILGVVAIVVVLSTRNGRGRRREVEYTDYDRSDIKIPRP